MSFVINTTVDKNQELLDAYKSLYRSGASKDVFLISRSKRYGCDSFALALSSDFFKTILQESSRETTNIILPDIEPEIISKLIEYIYNGQVSLDSKNVSEFIEACNLLQLKAIVTCEKKLVFDSSSTPIGRQASIVKISAEQTNELTKQTQLDSLMADLDQDMEEEEEVEEQNIEYHLKEEADGGSLMEVYEIAHIDESEMYEENDDEELADEQYELLNVEPEVKDEDTNRSRNVKTPRKYKVSPDSRPRNAAKPIDDASMTSAIEEIFNNSISFGAASEKYHIPKTLLWRRARKLGYVKSERPKDSTRVMAIEAIKQGESLISLSKKFNIPISTLHREKLKLYEKGQLPENVNLRNRSRGDDYEERLRAAIVEILSGKSQNDVAKRHQIAKTTIWRIIKKITPEEREKISNNDEISSEIVDRLVLLSKKRCSGSLNNSAASSSMEMIVPEEEMPPMRTRTSRIKTESN